ncbi:MAG: hypothetical protein ACRCX2_10475 [Paraclostridium sp.]
MLERQGNIYDVISLVHDTRQNIEDNKLDLMPYEPVIAVDTNELLFKDEQNNIVNAISAGIVNVATDLVNAKSYKVGDVVHVLGYYNKGDGAHHYRQKVDGTYTGGDAIDCVDGNKWKIAHNGEVNVSWFGAKGNSDGDDSSHLIKALSLNTKVILDKSIYINSVNTITTAVNIDGLNNTIFINLFTGSLKFEGIDGITIVNCRFVTPGSESATGSLLVPIWIKNSRNILIENVFLRLRRSGQASEIGEGFYSFLLRDCNNITLNKIHQNDSYPEGVYFEHSDTINVTNSIFEGTITWTVFHAFYSNNVTILNNRFKENQTGSTVNLTCSNLLFENNTVIGGTGVDISNESSTPFKVENVIIRNNVINTDNLGIFDYPYTDLGNNVLVESNEITCSGVSAISVNYDNYTIRNNIIKSNSSEQTTSAIRIRSNGEFNIVGNKCNSFSNFILVDPQVTIDNKNTNTIIGNKVKIGTVSADTSTTFNYGNFILHNSPYSCDMIIRDNIAENIYGSIIVNRTAPTTPSVYLIENNDFYGSVSYQGNRTLNYNNIINLNNNYIKNLLLFSGDIETMTGKITLKANTILDNYSRIPLNHSYTSTTIPVTSEFNIMNFTPATKFAGEYNKIIGYISLNSLDTPYYTYKMQQQGIYDDYVGYRDELHEYTKSLNQEEDTMLLPVLQEPEIPESIKTFAEEYGLI